MKCEICGTEKTSFAWTDTHGVAQCLTCGTPYLLLHYENDVRIEKEPQLLVLWEFVPLLQAYWKTTHCRFPSGHSFPGGQELATREEHILFNEWMEKHNTAQGAK
jgi:hypothetical protein